MEDLVATLLSIIIISVGLYYFKNPKKMQQKEIDRLRWFKFLLKVKCTSWMYHVMLEDVSDKSYLKKIKVVSVMGIAMGFLILLILLYKYIQILF